MAKIFNLSNLTLLTALTLSSIAAWYSIIGLTAIFSGAVMPIIIMGGVLEVAKIVTIVWLRNFWKHCGFLLKLYLVPAVIVLALLTSMGIFGFLSKSHQTQTAISDNISAAIESIDDKIKTQQENIDFAKRTLRQLDEQVDARLSRSNTVNGAERAAQLRRQQSKERARIQKDISTAQAIISQLKEERAPIASKLRVVENEVGPIRYIAALIYGDNPDNNLLERSVRWVIIFLVLVFDPLAIALVLAGNSSKDWSRNKFKSELKYTSKNDNSNVSTDDVRKNTIDRTVVPELGKVESDMKNDNPYRDREFDIKEHPYIFKGGFGFKNDVPIQIYKPDLIETPKEELPKQEEDVISKRLKITADNTVAFNSNFGTSFPLNALRGDVFVRVDMLPNRVYRYDGIHWIEINKKNNDTYLHNEAYIQYLIQHLENGQYDVEMLSEIEKDEIRRYLKKMNLGNVNNFE